MIKNKFMVFNSFITTSVTSEYNGKLHDKVLLQQI